MYHLQKNIVYLIWNGVNFFSLYFSYAVLFHAHRDFEGKVQCLTALSSVSVGIRSYGSYGTLYISDVM